MVMPADEELLRRAVTNAYCRPALPRWAIVKDIFALGSTYAADLCRRFGLDPDEKVSR